MVAMAAAKRTPDAVTACIMHHSVAAESAEANGNYGQVYISQYTNGHLLCYKCSLRVVECPICRAHGRTRNRFAETYVERYLSNIPTTCHHLTCQASMVLNRGELFTHEKFCIHREVHCFDKTQCDYWGPISQLY